MACPLVCVKVEASGLHGATAQTGRPAQTRRLIPRPAPYRWPVVEGPDKRAKRVSPTSGRYGWWRRVSFRHAVRHRDPGDAMETLGMTRCESVRLVPDPRRVITKPFLPREEIYADGSTRMQAVLRRIVAMSDSDVDETLDGARDVVRRPAPRPRRPSSPAASAWSHLTSRRLDAGRLDRDRADGRSSSADRRLLHARVLDRGGGARQSVDRRRS